MPLRTALSDFDVLTDRFELIALRLLRRSDVPQAEIESEIARAKKDAEKLMEYATTMSSILDQAVADEQVPEEPRRDYAELKSALPFIVRHLDTLIQTGERVFEAIGKGHTEEARTLSLEFRKTEQAFGSDTSELRQKLAATSAAALRLELAKLRTLERISYVLFALAVCLGIGVGRTVAENIVRGLRQLVDVSKAVQAGERSIAIPIRSNDEVG